MCFFFFNDTATTEIYTLSLHDALPICMVRRVPMAGMRTATEPNVPMMLPTVDSAYRRPATSPACSRSEEHTSELQSRQYLVCRLLLEKKKNQENYNM